MEANDDHPTKLAIGLALLLLAVPAVVFALSSTGQAKPSAPAKPTSPPAASDGRLMQRVLQLLRFASSWWFPWVAALGTAVNLFTLIFTAATVVMFLAAILGRPTRWAAASVINAIGAAAGSAALLFVLRSQGLDLLDEQFPTIFNSPKWEWMMEFMQGYGVVGMIAVSALPLILHPIIAFGILSGMNDASILLIILVGRTIKYLVMGWAATHAPAALKYFGIKPSLFSIASSGVAKK